MSIQSIQSIQILYDIVPVSIQIGSGEISLFNLLVPVMNRVKRREMILRVIEWIHVLRHWFEHPGPLITQLSHFFENLGWPAFRDLQLIDFEEMREIQLNDGDVSMYHLCIGGYVLNREWSKEQFSIYLAIHLMM